MAIPTGGTIAIISAPQTCGSICAAVGVACGSLCGLGIIAGKTASYTMSSFYTYAPSWRCVGLSNISTAGTCGTSTVCSTDCICISSAMVVGQCYTITLCHALSANTCTTSRAVIIVTCGGTKKYCCCTCGGCAACNFSCSFAVNCANTLCVLQCAIHPCACPGTGKSCTRTCITSVGATCGLICLTSVGCTCCCIYSC